MQCNWCALHQLHIAVTPRAHVQLRCSYVTTPELLDARRVGFCRDGGSAAAAVAVAALAVLPAAIVVAAAVAVATVDAVRHLQCGENNMMGLGW